MLECRYCGIENKADTMFCESCSAPLNKKIITQPKRLKSIIRLPSLYGFSFVGKFDDGSRKAITISYKDIVVSEFEKSVKDTVLRELGISESDLDRVEKTICDME
jgi:hypothetical protein